MQSLQDLHLFDDDQISKTKEESINELIKDPYIMKVLSDWTSRTRFYRRKLG